jgi:hypothetical protein
MSGTGEGNTDCWIDVSATDRLQDKNRYGDGSAKARDTNHPGAPRAMLPQPTATMNHVPANSERIRRSML